MRTRPRHQPKGGGHKQDTTHEDPGTSRQVHSPRPAAAPFTENPVTWFVHVTSRARRGRGGNDSIWGQGEKMHVSFPPLRLWSSRFCALGSRRLLELEAGGPDKRGKNKTKKRTLKRTRHGLVPRKDSSRKVFKQISRRHPRMNARPIFPPPRHSTKEQASAKEPGCGDVTGRPRDSWLRDQTAFQCTGQWVSPQMVLLLLLSGHTPLLFSFVYVVPMKHFSSASTVHNRISSRELIRALRVPSSSLYSFFVTSFILSSA